MACQCDKCECKREIKVFRLNEFDWVAAETKEQAIEWYMKETGLTEDESVDDAFYKECDIDKDFLFVDIDCLPVEEQEGTFEILRRYGTLCVKRTFKEMLEMDKRLTFPCVIASTEQ